METMSFVEAEKQSRKRGNKIPIRRAAFITFHKCVRSIAASLWNTVAFSIVGACVETLFERAILDEKKLPVRTNCSNQRTARINELRTCIMTSM